MRPSLQLASEGEKDCLKGRGVKSFSQVQSSSSKGVVLALSLSASSLLASCVRIQRESAHIRRRKQAQVQRARAGCGKPHFTDDYCFQTKWCPATHAVFSDGETGELREHVRNG
jgi:hypothetical protein